MRKALILAVLAAAGAGFWAGTRWSARPDAVRAAFHKLFHKQGTQTYNRTFWRGVPVQKCPMDLWTFQEILHETKPDVLVEAGTYKGGSSYYFASLFDLMDHGRVITIDIEDYPGKPKHPRVTFIPGSSTAPQTLSRVRELIAPAEKVMVVLDSDHHGDHVLQELKLYSPLVSPGYYLIVEDTHFNGHPILPNFGFGPYEAVQVFLNTTKGFAADPDRERFLLSFNPGGYLRRALK